MCVFSSLLQLQSVTGLSSPPPPSATEAEGSVLGDGLTPQEQKAIADLEQALFGKPTPPVKKQ